MQSLELLIDHRPVSVHKRDRTGYRSLEQYEAFQDVLRVRDHVAFGYDASERDLASAVRTLVTLLPDVLPQTVRKAA